MGFSTQNQLSANPATVTHQAKFRLHGLMSSEISWMVPIMINSNANHQDVLSYGYNLEVLVNVLKIFIKCGIINFIPDQVYICHMTFYDSTGTET